jgi:hypothetical protein
VKRHATRPTIGVQSGPTLNTAKPIKSFAITAVRVGHYSMLMLGQIACRNTIKTLFGAEYGLERRLPIALQFVTFSSDQRAVLKKASSLPPNISTMMEAFHNGLSAAEQADPQFAYRVAFVPKVGNREPPRDCRRLLILRRRSHYEQHKHAEGTHQLCA